MLIAKLKNKIHIIATFHKDFYENGEKNIKRYIFFIFPPYFYRFKPKPSPFSTKQPYPPYILHVTKSFPNL